jgi:hypothetical protein
LIVIKGTQLLVDSGYPVILVSVQNILVILQRKVVVSFLEIGLEAIFDVSFDLAHCVLYVLYFKLVFGHVNIEFFEIIGDILDLFFDIVFFVI